MPNVGIIALIKIATEIEADKVLHPMVQAISFVVNYDIIHLLP